MEKLKDQLLAVAKEYARQFGMIIEMEPEYWVGNVVDICSFGDCYFFTLEDMQVVVDNIDKYVKKYGSKEEVGNQVREWVNWYLDGVPESGIVERIEKRVTYQIRPNINLRSWLDGCPREGIEPWRGPDADYLRFQNAEETLVWLIGEFREARTLGNVLENVRSKLKVLREQKEKRDHETFERMIGKRELEKLCKSMENSDKF